MYIEYKTVNSGRAKHEFSVNKLKCLFDPVDFGSNYATNYLRVNSQNGRERRPSRRCPTSQPKEQDRKKIKTKQNKNRL